MFDRNCIECHNEREQPGDVDLTGDKTDFFNVSYDILCRTGTQAERNWIQHGSPSGPEYDKVRGMSPYTEWIWTINGAGHNVLEIAPRRWGSPASKLAEIIRTGHPDEDGKPRVDVPDDDRRRVYLWLDLNVPYYGTSSSNHKARLGSRRMLPLDLDSTLSEVASRRCASCHEDGIPRKFYTRIDEAREQQLPAGPAGQGGRRHPEVRQAGVRVEGRSRLPEDPRDLRADPRAAEGTPAGRHGGIQVGGGLASIGS